MVEKNNNRKKKKSTKKRAKKAAKTEYKWQHFGFDVDPNIAAKTIEKLRKEHGGTVTPEQLLEAASSKRSPLHDAFEWDDEEAANNWRVHQARQMLVGLVIVPSNDHEPVRRAFVNMSRGNGTYQHDKNTHDAVTQDLIVERAFAELQSWRRRYEMQESSFSSDLLSTIDHHIAAHAHGVTPK